MAGVQGSRQTNVLATLGALVARDFQARYRRTVLGPLWAVLQPVMLMIIFVMIRSIVGLPEGDVPYPLLAYAGLLPWTFLSNAVTRSTNAIYINAPIIRKVYLPREVFPLSVIVSSLVDFLFAGVVFIGLIIYYGWPLGPTVVMVLPLIGLCAALAFGVGLFTSSAAAFKRDITFIVPMLLQLWLFASPVIYTIDRVPAEKKVFNISLLRLYNLNPMSGIIQGFRSALLYGEFPDMGAMVSAVAVTVVIVVLGLAVFRPLSTYFADHC